MLWLLTRLDRLYLVYINSTVKMGIQQLMSVSNQLDVNLCTILTFAKVRSRDGVRRRDCCGWRVMLLSCPRSIDTFLRRSSPLTTDLCLSESKSILSVFGLAILQAARRKPLLSYSRWSGLDVVKPRPGQKVCTMWTLREPMSGSSANAC